VVTYTYDAWGKPLTISGSMASTLGTHNPLRYRGYVYDTETGLYYLQSRYYDPEVVRFINGDACTTTGIGLLGNNMFAYCNNNPVNLEDYSGYLPIHSSVYNRVSRCNANRDGGGSRNSNEPIPFTVSLGGTLSVGVGPLVAGIQVSLVTDSSGNSEVQISYIAPTIFNSSMPSVDEMIAEAGSDKTNFDIGASACFNMSFTNAPSVKDLHGPAYSIGGSISGIAIDYNMLPYGDDPNKAYQGITISSGMITPAFNVSMSNTFYSFSVPFSVFDIAESVNRGLYGM